MEKTFLLLLVFAFSSISVLAQETDNDIILTTEQQATLEVTSNPKDIFAPQNAVVRSTRSLWPNGLIPYVLDNLNSQAVTAITDAMADYTRLTCIRFVLRTNQADYVRFFAGNGCFSYIGRIGGPQDISIGRGCEFKGIVIHEIFHALGRWHEQSRPDRDQYVRILPENIRSGTESNFDITNPSFVTTQGVPYDIGSIMHYRSNAFSRNGQPTILPVDASVPASSLGQRTGLSARDLQHVQTLYCGGESGGSSGSWSNWSSFSACTQTCNGGSRTRTRTCVGGTSCEGSNIQVEQCNTQSCPVAATWGQWSNFGSCTTSCGGGRQRRTRSCMGGNTCVGIMTEFRDCNTQDCPEAATWASWGSWSACSRTCQGGFRQRNRRCMNGNTCPGSSVESESCNSNIPCTQTVTTQWSSWSDCTANCGGGQRFRTRTCSSPCENTQTESCNTQDCQPEPEILGTKYHGCWYLNTQSRRIGSLEGRGELTDDFRTRANPISKCGTTAEEYGYRLFALTAGGLCATGSNNLEDYQYFRSQLCQDGRGGFNRGWYIMDVYEVDDRQSFDSSAAQALNRTTITNSTMGATDTTLNRTTTEQTTNSTMGATDSGYKLTYSIVSMFVTLILAIAAF